MIDFPGPRISSRSSFYKGNSYAYHQRCDRNRNPDVVWHRLQRDCANRKRESHPDQGASLLREHRRQRRTAYSCLRDEWPISTWLRLAGSEHFCQYTLASDGSRIHLSFRTLLAKRPTLAALAYYAQTPWNGIGQGSPASFYCTQLGGTDLFGGVNFAGGGWVKFNTTDVSLDVCIFPDNSTIDAWGLFYHSAGIIRGIDLSTVLKYPNPYTAKENGAR